MGPSCMQAAADRHCDGRMVAVHEGGYSELYVPFCGLAVIEQLARTRSKVGGVVCSWGGGIAQIDRKRVVWCSCG